MIKIYLDTNVLEDRSDKCAIIYEKIFPESLYKFVKFVKENSFEQKIAIVIPELVIDEIIPHFINSYKSCKAKIETTISEVRNIVRGYFVADNSFKDKNELELIERIKTCIESIIKDSNGLIVKEGIPTEIKMIYERAINKQLPFTVAYKDKKEYTDAGFKDVVLLETILLNNADDTLYLVTNDNGFLNLVEKLQITVVKSIDDAIKKLSFHLETQKESDELNIISKFKEDYMKEKIYSELKLTYDEQDCYKVDNVTISDDVAKVLIKLVNNETIYNILIKFEYSANEIINIEYSIDND